MTHVTTRAARDAFAELVNRVGFGRERVAITRRGRTLAVLVPAEDVEPETTIEPAAEQEE